MRTQQPHTVLAGINNRRCTTSTSALGTREHQRQRTQTHIQDVALVEHAFLDGERQVLRVSIPIQLHGHQRLKDSREQGTGAYKYAQAYRTCTRARADQDHLLQHDGGGADAPMILRAEPRVAALHDEGKRPDIQRGRDTAGHEGSATVVPSA